MPKTIMTQINYKSDFDFILVLKDCQGKEVGWPDYDWTAKFYTTNKANAYTASCVGGECVNCLNDNGRIHIVVNSPRMGLGQLNAELLAKLPNNVYPDGTQDVYDPQPLDIELVTGPGDNATEIEVELTVPYAVIDAYMTARAAGFGGTVEEYYAGLASLPSLSALVSDMEAGKEAVAEALTRRGYPTDPAESMLSMADKIESMSYGAGDFARLGYADTPEYIKEQIQHGIDRLAAWDDGSPSAEGFFAFDTALVFAPSIDLSRKTNANELYNRCTSLTTLPESLDFSRVRSATNCFYLCTALIGVPPLDTSAVADFTGWFYYCRELRRVERLDWRGVSGCSNQVFFLCGNLQYMLIANLGLREAAGTYDFTQASNWGAGSEENRRSLVDSLLTLSFDRAGAGYEPSTVALSAATKSFLTDEEIAAITAKGYTIA